VKNPRNNYGHNDNRGTLERLEPERVYRDKLSGTSTREQCPGLAALLDYARPGDAIVVVGIDRLGRNAAEVMKTIRELRDREIVLRSLREGIDTSNATGRMVAGVLASLAELELELGRERVAAAREVRRARGQAIGRPKALDASKAALGRRMHSSGEPVSTIANTLAVSRATVYRCWPKPTRQTGIRGRRTHDIQIGPYIDHRGFRRSVDHLQAAQVRDRQRPNDNRRRG
jgi:DNA invertase Pin-like site-specific DNA recombinase